LTVLGANPNLPVDPHPSLWNMPQHWARSPDSWEVGSGLWKDSSAQSQKTELLDNIARVTQFLIFYVTDVVFWGLQLFSQSQFIPLHKSNSKPACILHRANQQNVSRKYCPFYLTSLCPFWRSPQSKCTMHPVLQLWSVFPYSRWGRSM